MSEVTLIKAKEEDMENIWKMQVEAFSGLLETYQDYDLSPATEDFDKVMARFRQPWTTYYYIVAEGKNVGAIRIVDKKNEERKKISPLWIMPEYRGKGYAQAAIEAVEKIHGAHHWSLGTILQEKRNLHLYEKMGYRQNGIVEKINDRMDIVIYDKD